MNANELKARIEQLDTFRERLTCIKTKVLINKPEDISGFDYSELTILSLLDHPVSKVSVFQDPIWDFNQDVINPAPNVKGAKLRIDFSRYEFIPKLIITELKVLFQYIYLLPKKFKKPARTSREKGGGRVTLKANTLIAHFQAGLRYLDHMFSCLDERYSARYVAEKYQSLSDVAYEEFDHGMKSFKGTKDSTLKTFLSYLTHPSLTEFLGVNLAYSEDILGKVKKKIIRGKEQGYKPKFFTNEEFVDLITYSSNRVMQFLIWQGKEDEIVDSKSLNFYKQYYKERFDDDFKVTRNILNEYTAIRLLSKGYSTEYIERACSNLPGCFYNDLGVICDVDRIRRSVKRRYGISNLDDLRKQINEFYYASCFLISQFMGARPEELSNVHFERSIGERDGVPVILSNVGKNKYENLKLFDEAWVMTPIMEDAFNVANTIGVIYQNEFLLGNVDTKRPSEKQREMTSSGMNNFFSKYIANCLSKNAEKSNAELSNYAKFNPYFFRHTLAFQLHRMGVGLPLISFQLKHMVTGIERFTEHGSASEVTVNYGGIATSIVDNPMQNDFYQKMAEREKVYSTFDPEGNYVGEQANRHKARIKKFFAGYMAAGYTKDEVMDQLVDQGIAIIDVGTGFCAGGKEDFDESLPCIGTLRCNPIRCKHAIIGNAHIPKWQELYFVNKVRLAKEQDLLIREQLESILREAKMVLEQLGVEV